LPHNNVIQPVAIF